jgi:hypothetical protein
MAYTNIIFDDITCIPDFRVPLQVTFGIIERKFKIIEFELVQMTWISSNDSTVTQGCQLAYIQNVSDISAHNWCPLCGHELHTIRSLTGNTTRLLCGSYARCPPNAPVVTKAMVIDLMTTHTTNCQCDTTPLEITTDV